MSFRRCERKPRRGVAVVELAVCLPVLAVLVLGTLECTTMIFVEQSLHVVAYETARVAIRGSSSNADVTTRANQMITERKLRGAVVTLNPANIENLPRGGPISVTVTAPAASNAVLPLKFFGGNLEAVANMNKE